jgi:hypothetical protein
MPVQTGQKETIMFAYSNLTRIGVGALVVVAVVVMATPRLRAQDKWTVWKVGTIVANPDGTFAFKLEKNLPVCLFTPQGLDQEALRWVAVTGYVTDTAKTRLLTLLTTAKSLGRSVQVRGRNNSTPGEWGCRFVALDFF